MLLSPGLLVLWCDKNKHQGCIQLHHTASTGPTLLAPCAQCLAHCPVLSHILICFFHPVSLAGAAPLLPSRQGELPAKQQGLGEPPPRGEGAQRLRAGRSVVLGSHHPWAGPFPAQGCDLHRK